MIPIDLALVKAINGISSSLDKLSVAEYVENKESCFALKGIGVDYGQGYFIARPMPIEKVKGEFENIFNNKVFYQQSPS